MGDLGRNFGVCEADADTLTSAGEEQRMLVNVVTQRSESRYEPLTSIIVKNTTTLLLWTYVDEESVETSGKFNRNQKCLHHS